MEKIGNTEQLEQNLLELHQNYVKNKETQIPEPVKQAVLNLEAVIQSNHLETKRGEE
jgi:hypothetical protein